MDLEARPPIAPEKPFSVDLSIEESLVTTGAYPSGLVQLARKLSLSDGERSRDETDSNTDVYPDSELSFEQANAADESMLDTECSKLCPLNDQHSIHEPLGTAHSDTKQEPPDQAIQAGKLYKPISDWQSRIVALQPGELGDPIRVDLHVADLINASGIALHDKPLRVQYEALSYCWGTENATCVIQMNGIDYPVVETLYQALRRVRTDEVRYLWIDALCIDQHNLEERSMQVANMLLLFQKATKVLVWLGEHGKHTRVAWQCLDSRRYDDIGIPLSNSCPKHRSNLSLGFEEIISRPWYRRLWILQEVWAASQVDVILGEDTLKWDTLETFATQYERILWHKHSDIETNSSWLHRNDNPFVAARRAAVQKDVSRCSPHRSNAWRLEVRDSSKGRKWHRNEDLIAILGGTYSCECRDPRDRVYAVLGMTNAKYAAVSKVAVCDKETIPVDYGKSISEVYQDVVRYYAVKDNTLDILCMDASFGGQVGGQELPSWCPNWSLPFGKERPYELQTFRKRTRRSRSDDGSGPDERRDWSDINASEETLSGSHAVYSSGGDYQYDPIAIPSWRVLSLTGYVFATVTRAALWQDRTTYQNSLITVEYTHPHRKKKKAKAAATVEKWSDEGLCPQQDKRGQSRYKGELGGSDWCVSGKIPRISDVLVIVGWVSRPLVLRAQAEESQYKFIGVVVQPEYREGHSWGLGSKNASCCFHIV